MQNYLNDVIVNNFRPLINQNIYSAIKDTNGCILCSTNILAQSAGFDKWEEVIGMSYNSTYTKIIRAKMGVTNSQIIDQIQDYFNLLYKLELLVVKEKVVVSFIEMIPYRSIYESYLCTLIPLFNPNEEVIAIQLYYSTHKLFGINDYFEQFNTIDNNKLIKLTEAEINEVLQIFAPRELEIAYLLTIGFSQYQIADILQIGRGTIAKVISDQICPKLGIIGSSTRQVIEKIREMNCFQSPPKSLLRPLVLILDEEVNKKLQETA